MKWMISFFLPFIFAALAFAQAPDTLWTTTCGGFLNDYGNSVDITVDGDYIVVGETYSLESGSYDIYLVKISSSGDTIWSKTYGGIQSEYGNAVIQTSDGGFAVAGETRSFGSGSYDIYLLKTDPDGDTLWTRTYGGDDYEEGHSIAQTGDGGYIITGSTRSSGLGYDDVCLVKTDSIGNPDWIKTYGGVNHDCGNWVEQTTDGGYIIAGESESFPVYTLYGYVIKTDAAGDTLWTKSYGGEFDDALYCIQPTSDNGYILAGFTTSFGAGMADVWLVKIDESGDTLWTRTYGGTNDDYIYCVRQASDSGYILAGWSESYHIGDSDVYIIKTDSLGNITWSGNYGGQGADIGMSIKQTSDEGYIIAGSTTSYGAGNNDVYIISLPSDETGFSGYEADLNPGDIELHCNYPNPFNASTTISFELAKPASVKLSVYDLLGREIAILAAGYLDSGSYKSDFDASRLSSGVYFYRLRVGDEMKAGRMVLLK